MQTKRRSSSPTSKDSRRKAESSNNKWKGGIVDDGLGDEERRALSYYSTLLLTNFNDEQLLVRELRFLTTFEPKEVVAYILYVIATQLNCFTNDDNHVKLMHESANNDLKLFVFRDSALGNLCNGKPQTREETREIFFAIKHYEKWIQLLLYRELPWTYRMQYDLSHSIRGKLLVGIIVLIFASTTITVNLTTVTEKNLLWVYFTWISGLTLLLILAITSRQYVFKWMKHPRRTLTRRRCCNSTHVDSGNASQNTTTISKSENSARDA